MVAGEHHPAAADALVLFGATGDLSKKKLMPALYNLEAHGRLTVPSSVWPAVTGATRPSRSNARESILAVTPDADPAIIDAVCKRLDLVQGDYADPRRGPRSSTSSTRATRRTPCSTWRSRRQSSVGRGIARIGRLNSRGRIVVEKPFGRDLASARELKRNVARGVPEERIFRIDHYLGKESVEDLLVFRFSNTLLEPIWNRNYVRSVQITMSESIGSKDAQLLRRCRGNSRRGPEPPPPGARAVRDGAARGTRQQLLAG